MIEEIELGKMIQQIKSHAKKMDALNTGIQIIAEDLENVLKELKRL